MGAHAIQQTDSAEQLALYGRLLPPAAARAARTRNTEQTRMCAACRAHEARYGFRDRHDDPLVGRPNTLCFDCFRMEIDRRHAVAAQVARGWNATQASLPLTGKLEALSRRRRRAQIAARHALDVR